MTQQNQLFLLARVNLLQSWRRLRSIHSTSKLLTLSIVLFMIGYNLLSFFLFSKGLRFVNNFPALGAMLLERLLYLLFAFLLVLLIFSNLIIGYGNYFHNRETSFLLPMPISAQTVFQWKFIESTLLASWAFLFLVAPLLAAYGLTLGVPWHFYLMTMAAIAMFIVLPGVAGAWVALGVARLLDRRAFQIAAIAAGLALLPLLHSWLMPQAIAEDPLDARVLPTLDKLLNNTRFAESPWLPSYWLSISVIHWSEGALHAAGFFLLVLLSNVLFLGCLCFTCTGGIFFDSLSTVHSRVSIFDRWQWFQNRRAARLEFRYPVGPMEKCFRFLFNPPPGVLAMLVKDARLFWRDTSQWSQTLILMGLLGVYIINLRHFSEQLTNPFWVHLVCYLNLGACALNLATLTTRFVYPQFSLEGKRLWIIGMAPLGMVQILRTKFWLASRAALVLTVPLILLSCHMLRIDLDHTCYLTLIIGTMTFTLTGLATGLSALFPNFREDNPAKIVSGFGGTLCLVLSFLYITASVALVAIGSPWGWRGATSIRWILSSWAGFVFISLIFGMIPFRLGLRRVERFEL